MSRRWALHRARLASSMTARACSAAELSCARRNQRRWSLRASKPFTRHSLHLIGRAAMDIGKIPIGRNPPHDINVIVEIPQGGAPVKYEIDKESGALFVDRFLHTAMFYPCNYGFVPHTKSQDGDPID